MSADLTSSGLSPLSAFAARSLVRRRTLPRPRPWPRPWRPRASRLHPAPHPRPRSCRPRPCRRLARAWLRYRPQQVPPPCRQPLGPWRRPPAWRCPLPPCRRHPWRLHRPSRCRRPCQRRQPCQLPWRHPPACRRRPPPLRRRPWRLPPPYRRPAQPRPSLNLLPASLRGSPALRIPRREPRLSQTRRSGPQPRMRRLQSSGATSWGTSIVLDSQSSRFLSHPQLNAA